MYTEGAWLFSGDSKYVMSAKFHRKIEIEMEFSQIGAVFFFCFFSLFRSKHSNRSGVCAKTAGLSIWSVRGGLALLPSQLQDGSFAVRKRFDSESLHLLPCVLGCR